MTDYIDIREYRAAVDDLQSLWLNFEDSLRYEQTIPLNTAYNLISITLRENSLSAFMTTILSDNNTTLSTKHQLIIKTLLEALVELLSSMGIILNKDYIDISSLDDLNNILNMLYSTDDVDDVLGLIDILDNDTFDNKDKLISAIVKTFDLDDEGNLPYIIEDVSADVIKGLYIGLGALTIDDGDYVNPDVAKRIKKNKTFIGGTLAGDHILNGGGAGVSYVALTNLLVNELGVILLEDKARYYKEILAICLISSMTSIEIQEGYEVLIKDMAEDMQDIYIGSKLLEEINL